jgi:hypothetical protein
MYTAPSAWPAGKGTCAANEETPASSVCTLNLHAGLCAAASASAASSVKIGVDKPHLLVYVQWRAKQKMK